MVWAGGWTKKRTGVTLIETTAGLSVSLTSSHPAPSSPVAPCWILVRCSPNSGSPCPGLKPTKVVGPIDDLLASHSPRTFSAFSRCTAFSCFHLATFDSYSAFHSSWASPGTSSVDASETGWGSEVVAGVVIVGSEMVEIAPAGVPASSEPAVGIEPMLEKELSRAACSVG